MVDVKNLKFGELLGYSEMFEWDEQINDDFPFHCKLVQFSEQHPNKVIRAKSIKNIVGISTLNSSYRASNPDEWPFKYIINEFGDLFLTRKSIAEGTKKYDSINEMTYIQTSEKKVIVPVDNPSYDSSKEYLTRQNRPDWCTVTILGKAIIEDNGKCEAGKYCTLYQGEDDRMTGTVIPANDDDKFKLYVLNRISNHTIMVLFIPQIYSNIN